MRSVRDASFLAALLLLLSGAGCSSPGEGHSLKFEGRTRRYWVFQPELPDGADPLPLVINLHGFSESAALEAYRSDMNAFAEKKCFIVCYPEGTGLRRAWNTDGRKRADDIGFISTLIDTLISNYNVDTSRIYLVGFSNGGQMAMFAGAALSERIAGIAVAGAGISQEQLDRLNLEGPVRLISFNSRNDPASIYEGCKYKGVFYPPIYEIISSWAKKCGCNRGPDSTIFDGGVLKIRWHNDSTGMEVVLWVTPEGGHTWPGGRGIPFPGGSRPNQKINSNELMWEFYKANRKPKPSDGDPSTSQGPDKCHSSRNLDAIQSIHTPPSSKI
jgi:polyhydroxybutyrate depolymerase